MAKIYVSSTYRDLKDQRRAVLDALRRADHDVEAMEFYVAEDNRPLERCLEDVSQCDLYVGIVAWWYGYQPDRDNPDRLSITRLEYERAVSEGKPRLLFLTKDDAHWPVDLIEVARWSELSEFRNKIKADRLIAQFSTTDELVLHVNEAVRNWEKSLGGAVAPKSVDWDGYRAAVVNRHQWVRLQVVAAAAKERGPIQIPLHQVFENVLVTARASTNDIPDVIRRYQKVIYDQKPLTIGDRDAKRSTAFERRRSQLAIRAQKMLMSENNELVLDVIGRERKQVILGGPGTGKSTVLHFAALQLCRLNPSDDGLPVNLDTCPVPFIVELRDYVMREKEDFIQYICARAQEFYGVAVEADDILKLLELEGRAIVFFDGLDEVFDPVVRRRVIDQFRSFSDRFPDARIVVTSRIAGYNAVDLGVDSFQHYTLLPLTLAQIAEFATNWYRFYTLEGTDRTAEGLAQRIADNPRLLDLAGNPLLLTMMAVIYKDRDLPNERWRLYERSAEMLLEEWDYKGKHIEIEQFAPNVQLRSPHKSEILQLVSTYMLDHGQQGKELNAIAYDPLLKLVATYLQAKYSLSTGSAEAVTVDILQHLTERTYVLAEVGERIFGFVHRTFMEYFAACRCKALFNERLSDFEWLNNEIFGPHWKAGDWDEVLLLLIAMLQAQNTPISTVVEHLLVRYQREDPANLVFAARCLAEPGDIKDKPQAERVLAMLAQELARYPNTRRDRTREFLEEGLRAFSALAPLVVPPEEVRQAIETLRARKSTDAKVTAWQMGFALQAHQDRITFALNALADSEPAVRKGAIAALEREWPGRRDIIIPLCDILRSDRSTSVRMAALDALERSWSPDPAILDAIRDRAGQRSNTSWTIRQISYLRDVWHASSTARDIVIELVTSKRDSQNVYDQLQVVEAGSNALATGLLGDANPRMILEQLVTSVDPVEVSLATGALLKLPQDDNLQANTLLTDAVRNGEPLVRLVALRAYSEGVGDNDPAWEELMDLAVNDLEEEVRDLALEVIANRWRNSDQVLPFLVERAINEESAAIGTSVVRTLATDWAPTESTGLAILSIAEANVSNPDSFVQILDTAATALRLRSRNYGIRSQQWSTSLLSTFLMGTSHPSVYARTSAIYQLKGVFQLAAKVERWPYLITQNDLFALLSGIADRDDEPSVRLAALYALTGLRVVPDSVRAGLLDEETVAAFVRLRRDFIIEQVSNNPNPTDRARAIDTIVACFPHDLETLRIAEERSMYDNSPIAREAAFRVLVTAYQENDEVAEFLDSHLLREPNEDVRSRITSIREFLEKNRLDYPDESIF
ncbi:MAG: DUF4062 domain-containing protein [Anaerolineae bacterium]